MIIAKILDKIINGYGTKDLFKIDYKELCGEK